MPKKLSDIEFAQLFQSIGPTQLSHKTGTSVRNIFERRTRLEARLGVVLTAPTTLAPRSNTTLEATGLPEGEAARSMHEDFKDGVVLIGGDGHYWPGKASTAHRAFVYMAKQLKPKIIVFNGDAVDGATISRHPPIGWENLPSLADELAVVQERLGEIWHAAPKAKHIWPLATTTPASTRGWLRWRPSSPGSKAQGSCTTSPTGSRAGASSSAAKGAASSSTASKAAFTRRTTMRFGPDGRLYRITSIRLRSRRSPTTTEPDGA
jgi:hypothetical protein